MFYLSRIEHTLRLPPSLLSYRLRDAVKGELEKIFLDKVISNLGLCISVYDIDIDDIKDMFILPNDGHPTLKVNFTMIMFRPFVGEIITAKVIESTADGLRLSLGFFDDIYIPIHRFPTPFFKKGNSKKNVVLWFWKPPDSDEEYPIDLKDQVESVNYPKIPIEQPENSKPFAPMEVKGAIDFDGLGPVLWWKEVEEA
ncbi:uncharacterized protein LOC126786025 isoform X2 [Argentina anserina]|uniref:uncharacterized protein LOC126786025 isoform X2 n=1 Tax=Argentina anserina TaxID=57926 RepID=UPI00217622D1|nr:uncharacterized protein LOC126786025 isoform X2 [Potentilla anserina]